MEDNQHQLVIGNSVNVPICKVCGDRASGKHYGVSSCDGCRGFFKRSIRRNLEYVCKEGGKCIVDVPRRNQCQACRFAKCIQSNMRREAVQHERAPRTCNNYQQDIIGIPIDMYATQRRLPVHHPSGLILPIPVHLPTANFTFSPLDQPRYVPPLQARSLDSIYYGSSMFSPISSKYIDLSNLYENHSNNYNRTIQQSSIDTSKKFKFSVKDDEVTSSEEIHEKTTSTTDGNGKSKKDDVLESATKLLFLTIKWAKSMPSFMQISQKDQLLLLKEAWPELFLITVAQYGLAVENVLALENSKHQIIQKIIHQTISQRLDHTEAACLKALILFRPECSGLICQHQVSMLQEQSLNVLFDKSGGARMGHLLLLLPAIRSAADRIVLQELLFKNTIGEVKIEQILGEFAQS